MGVGPSRGAFHMKKASAKNMKKGGQTQKGRERTVKQHIVQDQNGREMRLPFLFVNLLE